ncbi:HNH endonuclease domain-containing protein [Jannaschia sp. W003]|uniref:HNH endonuclease domain-containing protein n=1 Tax=Jannaschia sp. W003 TaxID=2867012 RepID=UPI0021A506CB|nr:HNH endonuclease domain-containing protein [Jannaschia sp. W003]UWQ20073.1 hypothetical protein K3554_08620 [Jannaschia sp. W003]
MVPDLKPFPELGIDTAPLVQSMRAVTNSYKHLFLRALLARVRAGDTEPLFLDLLRGMLAEAWWPAFHYRLALGSQDMAVKHLSTLIEDPTALRMRPGDVLDYLAHVPATQLSEGPARSLLRYVPTRLLRPWFEGEVGSLPDGKRDRAIAYASRALFDDRRPLFRIEPDRIVVHPDWVAAIERYGPIFDGWSDAVWLSYLERRNPHATSLLAKVRPAFERASLTEERRVWSAHLRGGGTCVFSRASVTPDLFAVDHFLPHAFTGHDRFWNLSPIAPAVNASKRDGLPPEAAVDALACRHAALWHAADRLGRHQASLRRWRDDYAADLGFDPVGSDETTFRSAFRETYTPLFGIARRMGFPDWTPAGS